MRRRLAALLGLLVLATAVASTTPAAGVSAGASAAPIRAVTVSAGLFSPNKDGVKDTLVIRYYLPRAGDDVRLRISELGSGRNQNVRLLELGSAAKGTHTWTWDGRDKRGRVVDDGSYNVDITYSGAYDGARDRIIVDTSFFPELVVGAGPALPDGASPAIYPRSTAVRDVLELAVPGDYRDRNVRRLSLTIRDPRGRAVLRQVVRDVKTKGWGESLLSRRWTARHHGRALPSGRYRAVVSGVDRAGNRGRTEQRIWVSKERLVWHEEVRTVLPAGSEVGDCFFDGGPGCADAGYYNPPCGTVTTSQLYVGGLSYRSAVCPEGSAGSDYAGRSHWLPLPEALPGRGVASARVRFVGTPTHAGEGDVGTLDIAAGDVTQNSSITSGTGGETDDVVPRYGLGLSGDHTGSAEPIPPGVLWGFSTKGGESVDVKEFVVTARYLAVAD